MVLHQQFLFAIKSFKILHFINNIQLINSPADLFLGEAKYSIYKATNAIVNFIYIWTGI